MNCHAELDPLEASSLLSASERSLRDAAARATDERLLPIAADAFEKGEMPDAAVSALAQMDAFRVSIHLRPIAYSLIMQKIERADSGFRSCASVQTSLV